MYAQPKHALSEADARAALAAFDRAAILVVTASGGFQAVHLPILVRGGAILAHVARANPIWRAAPCAALLVCPGPETYVSPGWYPSKAETGRAVPTWSYEAIHVEGALSAFEDPAALLPVVAALSDRHEAGQKRPWSIADAPADYIDALSRGMVGLTLSIERISGKRKLSQERPAPDREGVLAALDASPDPRDQAVAAAMKAV